MKDMHEQLKVFEVILARSDEGRRITVKENPSLFHYSMTKYNEILGHADRKTNRKIFCVCQHTPLVCNVQRECVLKTILTASRTCRSARMNRNRIADERVSHIEMFELFRLEKVRFSCRSYANSNSFTDNSC